LNSQLKKQIMAKKILVTGATGNIASLVIPQLLENGVEVRAYVRDPQKAGSLKDAGVEIVQGDFSDKDALVNAASGVDAILAITPPNPDAVVQGDNIIAAAKSAGSPFVIRISALKAAADAPTDNGKLHFAADEALINSGLPYTILRPHFFMQNIFMSVPTIKEEGNMYQAMGEGKLGLIDVRDIADCAAAILLDYEKHLNKIYNPTGPETITFYDMANIIGDGMGKKVNYVAIPPEGVRQPIIDMGWGEWAGQVMVDYSQAYSDGWGDFTNDDVERLTGKKARSFKKFYDEVLSHALN